MRFSMLYSGEQILSFESCLVFYAGDSLKKISVQSCKRSCGHKVPRVTVGGWMDGRTDERTHKVRRV